MLPLMLQTSVAHRVYIFLCWINMCWRFHDSHSSLLPGLHTKGTVFYTHTFFTGDQPTINASIQQCWPSVNTVQPQTLPLFNLFHNKAHQGKIKIKMGENARIPVKPAKRAPCTSAPKNSTDIFIIGHAQKPFLICYSFQIQTSWFNYSRWWDTKHSRQKVASS